LSKKENNCAPRRKPSGSENSRKGAILAKILTVHFRRVDRLHEQPLTSRGAGTSAILIFEEQRIPMRHGLRPNNRK
jgi:hypothetical protein